jgi:hypothetical protein
MFNLAPNENGIVELSVNDLQNYSQLFIVAGDIDSVVHRQLDIND